MEVKTFCEGYSTVKVTWWKYMHIYMFLNPIIRGFVTLFVSECTKLTIYLLPADVLLTSWAGALGILKGTIQAATHE